MTSHWTVSSDDSSVTVTLRDAATDAARRVLGRLWIDQIPQRFAAGGAGPFVDWPPPVAELSGRARHLRAGRDVHVILLATGLTAAAARALAACSPAWSDRLAIVDTVDPGPVRRLIADPGRLDHAVVVIADPPDLATPTAAAEPADAEPTKAEPAKAEAPEEAAGALTPAEGTALPNDDADEAAPEATATAAAEPAGAQGSAPEAGADDDGTGEAAPEPPQEDLPADVIDVLADVLRDTVDGLRFTHAPGGDSPLCPAVLLAAALAGADIAQLASEAADALPALAGGEDNPGLVLGALMGGCARVGRDKVVLAAYPPLTGLATWIAPLLVTSGLVPIVQDGGFPVLPGDDRFLIAIGGRPHQDDATVAGTLGAHLVAWEYAAAAARYLTGAAAAPAVLPGVTKAGDRELRGDGTMEGVEVIDDDGVLGGAGALTDVIDALLTAVPQDGCLSIMSYMDPDPGDGEATATRHLAAALAARTPGVVTLVPPRPTAGTIHLLISGEAGDDVPVAEAGRSLGRLRTAQAAREAAALRASGGRVIRLHLNDRWAGFARLVTAAQGGRG